MSDRSVQHILQSDLHLHPYKLQVVQSLNHQDKEVRLQFSRHFQGILTENPDLPNNLLMSDEADFHLHGIVNKQKF
jgi:glycerophosphoryl diester phosphodiesterase